MYDSSVFCLDNCGNLNISEAHPADIGRLYSQDRESERKSHRAVNDSAVVNRKSSIDGTCISSL